MNNNKLKYKIFNSILNITKYIKNNNIIFFNNVLSEISFYYFI